MRRAVVVLGILGVVLQAGAARAADANATAEAKKRYAQGVRHYDLAEYEAALTEFKEAYRAADDPAFLFNIAQCHRKLGNLPEAITFYRTYLRRASNVPNRAELQRRIAELEHEQALRERAAAASGAPTTGALTPAVERRSPPPAPVAVVATASDPTAGREPAAALVGRDAAPSPSPAGGDAEAAPLYKRGWFWVAAGAVAVGAAAAIVIATRSRGDAQPFCPDCTSTAGLRGP
jgi:tetratricopeptide (TPR) repeat protein